MLVGSGAMSCSSLNEVISAWTAFLVASTVRQLRTDDSLYIQFKITPRPYGSDLIYQGKIVVHLHTKVTDIADKYDCTNVASKMAIAYCPRLCLEKNITISVLSSFNLRIRIDVQMQISLM